MAGSGRQQPPRRPRPRGLLARRIGVLLTACASALVLVVSGAGYGLLAWSSAAIERVDAFGGLTTRPPANPPGVTTFLLVGSDGREGMTAGQMHKLHVGNAETAAGRRADTMLLVRVSQQRDDVTVVSLPRDSYVTIPAHRAADGSAVRTRRNKLNAAYSAGGPQLTVATIERSTGVRIDHYLEVDFLGFVRLVDALGGVDLCSPTRLRDHKAGLRLPAGITHVNGRKGLAFVRARHLDARADLGRVERQQQFLGAMAHRVTSKDVLLDPRALVRFLDAALSAVRADPGLQRADLIRLATEVRHVSGGNVRFQTVPIADPSHWAPGAGSVALWDKKAAGALFTSLREDREPPRPQKAAKVTIPPSTVRLRVYNGSSRVGMAARASADLTARGFAVAGSPRDWQTSNLTRTVIRYDAAYSESIKTIAAALPDAKLQRVFGLGRTMEVVVGSSYEGAHVVHVAAPKHTKPNTVPTHTRTAADDPCS